MVRLSIRCIITTILNSSLICVLMAISLAANAQTSTMPAGNGMDDPYQIATLDNLFWLSQNPGQWGANFIQTANIDASSSAEWNGGKGFSPIGNADVRFTGTYSGQGHKIDGLAIHSGMGGSYMGFFGFAQSATIENLGLTNVDFKIFESGYVGGLAGIFDSGIIKKCFITGDIEVETTHLGGIVGRLSGSGEIRNSYSNVNIYKSSANNIGGLVGVLIGSVINSYSSGNLTGGGTQATRDIGGLIAYERSGSVINSYWSIVDSGLEVSDGGTGLSEADMRNSNSFESWDFSDTWIIEEDNTFPFLRDNIPKSLPGFISYEGGDGSVNNPYVVNSPYQLHQIRNYTDQYFIQSANIDFSNTATWDMGKGFTPIGNSGNPFAGQYDGSGYLINGLSIDRPNTDGVGLFGYSTGTLTNIGITNADVSGNSEVGVVVGTIDSDGTVSKSFSSGNVGGNSNIGGLAGSIKDGSISNSYSESGINGTEAIGGLAGYISSLGAVELSYSMGSVMDSRNTGGLLGVSDGGEVMDSYWNINSSGQTSSADGTGLTTVQMKQQNSYNGWDFIGCWEMSDGNSYPNLSVFPFRSLTHVTTGEEGWRMFGSPFFQSSFGTIVDALWTQGYPGSNDPLSETNLFIWNEPAGQWEIPVSQSASLNVGQGFIIYVYEDDDAFSTGMQGGFPKSIVHYQKLANILPVEIPLGYSESETSLVNGFNLVSNPTSAVIDWDLLNKTNVADTYYVWDSANEQYDLYQTGVGGVNGGTRLIDPFTGYWARAGGDRATLYIDNDAVVPVQNAMPRVLSKEQTYNTFLLQLSDDSGRSDELRVVLREDAETGLDKLDALKLTPLSSSYLSFTSLVEDNPLAIDSRPSNGSDPVVLDLSAVSINASTGQNYKLSLAEDQIDSLDIILKDLKSGSSFNLRENPVDVCVAELKAKSRAGISIPKQLSTFEPVWQLYLTPTSTEVENTYDQVPKELYLSQNYPNPFNPTTSIRYDIPVDGPVSLFISDMMGKRVANLINEYRKAGSYKVNFDASHLASGVYLYSLVTPSGKLHRRMTIIK